MKPATDSNIRLESHHDNTIEIAFSKLKALLRKRAARSFGAITKALGDIISLFSVAECRNFFKAAGYEAE
jgi:transposase